LVSFLFLIIFRYFVKQFWSLDANHKVKRELPCNFHIITTSTSCQLACPRHWANILGLE